MDDTEGTNIEEILSSIANCIQGGNRTASGSLMVTFTDYSIGKMGKTIEKAVGNLQKDSKDISENTKSSELNIGRIVQNTNDANKSLKEAGERLERIERERSQFRNFFRHPVEVFTKNFPIITSATKILASGVSNLLGIQMDNLNMYRELFKSGVLYNENLDQIHKDAADLGIFAQGLKKALIDNSTMYAKLGGLYGNSRDSFIKLNEAVKKAGMEIGVDFNTSVKIASSMVDSTFNSMMGLNNSFNTLINSTITYQKFLKQLSYATGKSADNILAAEKAREQDIAYQAWAKDPKNKIISAWLEQIGASRDIKDAFVTGMPNEAYTLASIQSFEQGRILDEVMNITRSSMSPEETTNALMKLMKNANKEDLTSVLNIDPLILSKMPEAFRTPIGINIARSDWSVFEKELKNESIVELSKLEDAWIRLKENFLGALTPKTLNPINDIIGSLTNTMNNFSEVLRNNDGVITDALKGIGDSIIGFINNINNILIPKGQDKDLTFENRIKKFLFGITGETNEDFNKEKNSWSSIFFEKIGKPLIDGIIDGISATAKYMFKEHPWASLLLAMTTFGSSFLLGINLLTGIVNTGLKVFMGSLSMAKIGVAGLLSYEFGVNATDLIDEYGSKAGTGIAYGVHRGWIGMKDIFGMYENEAEHQKAIQDANRRYDNGMKNAENTVMREIGVPGLLFNNEKTNETYDMNWFENYIDNVTKENSKKLAEMKSIQDIDIFSKQNSDEQLKAQKDFFEDTTSKLKNLEKLNILDDLNATLNKISVDKAFGNIGSYD